MNTISDLLSPEDLALYETHLRRLRYDDRDYVMYENMLRFLWDFIIGKKETDSLESICEEYSRWNRQMIQKVLYHSHNIPEANIRRCYQSIVELICHRPEVAFEEIEAIGIESFSYDGMAPKMRMDSNGRVFRPMSKLFVLYNFEKYYKKHGMEEASQSLKEQYSYAFTHFGDGEHQAHDCYLEEQLEVLHDKLIYPVEEKVYKIPWGPKDFYLYYDENSFINL